MPWLQQVGEVRSMKQWCSQLHALTSTQCNIFGMNWSADCEPDLITQQQRLTSPGLLWLDGRKYLQPCSKRLVERLKQDEWRFGSVSEQHVNDQVAFYFMPGNYSLCKIKKFTDNYT